MDKYKKLLSNTVIFAIGTFSSKLLVFLLMPLYTNVLSKPEYGVVDLLMQAGNLLLPLVSLGINNAVIRFGLDRDNDKSTVFTNGLFTLLCGYVVFLTLFPVLRLALTATNSEAILEHMFLLYPFVMCSTMRSMCANFIRARERVRLFAIDGVLSTAYTIGFNILFLVVLKWGIKGYMLAVICADVLSCVFLFLTGRLWQFIKPRTVKSGLLRPMLRYCVPMIPTTVFWWITNVSDRFIITSMISEEANGLYAVSQKIPTIITLVSGIFIDAWQMSAFTENDKNTRAEFFTRVFRSYQSFIFIAASGLILVTKLMTKVMVADAFYPAWEFTPFLIMATSFSCLVSFSGSVYMVEKKSFHILLTTLAGAVINMILNFILITNLKDARWQNAVNGAAFATFVSYAVVFLLRAINTRRLIPVQWGVPKLLINTAILAGQTVILILSPRGWLIMELALFAAMTALNFKGLWATLMRILKKVPKTQAE